MILSCFDPAGVELAPGLVGAGVDELAFGLRASEREAIGRGAYLLGTPRRLLAIESQPDDLAHVLAHRSRDRHWSLGVGINARPIEPDSLPSKKISAKEATSGFPERNGSLAEGLFGTRLFMSHNRTISAEYYFRGDATGAQMQKRRSQPAPSAAVAAWGIVRSLNASSGPHHFFRIDRFVELLGCHEP